MLRVWRFDDSLFSESIERYVIKDVYPAVSNIFPEIKPLDMVTDVSEIECTAGSRIDIASDCTMLKLGSNCRIVGSILQQASFTDEIGFADYYKTPNPHLYLCKTEGRSSHTKYGAWILDLDEPFILYFTFHEE